MIDDVQDIAEFYGQDPAREHSRLDRHQLEHDLTWRYLVAYLPDRGSILEVGAGTGRYSLELARRGHTVTAVDLSPELVEQARLRAVEADLTSRMRVMVADARDLGAVPADAFDGVLVMGPLYHLVEEVDRRTALQQAFERLHPGGLILSSFLSRLGVLADLVQRSPGWIEDQPYVRSLLDRGRRPKGAKEGGFRGYFARVDEIAPLHEGVGFETLALVGVEPVIAADDESFNALRGRQRELWLDLLQQVGTDPSILGASRHLLYVGRKPS